MKRAVVVTLILTCCGCSVIASSAQIFEQPQSYLGKRTTVCGYIHLRHEDTNVWPNKKTQEAGGVGLGIVFLGDVSEAKKLDNTTGCISGEMIKTGCKSDKKTVCTYSDFDYAIRMTR